MAVIEAFTIATLAPALLTLLVDSTGWFWAVLMVTAVHTVFLGVPAFWCIRRRGWLLTAVGAGVAIGALPFAVFMWPQPEWGSSASNSRYGATIIDGVTTAAGWRQHRDAVLILGALGGFAGFVFGAYLRIRNKLSSYLKPLTRDELGQ